MCAAFSRQPLPAGSASPPLSMTCSLTVTIACPCDSSGLNHLTGSIPAERTSLYLVSSGCRFVPNKSTNHVAFPHPQSCEDQYGEKDESDRPGVVWSIRRRIVNVTDDRNATDDVNPAKNGTFSSLFHGEFSFI